VIDLLVRALHTMSEPENDVVGIIGVKFAHMIKPTFPFGPIAGPDKRRSV
jgi:hypothetical protein